MKSNMLEIVRETSLYASKIECVLLVKEIIKNGDVFCCCWEGKNPKDNSRDFVL